MSLVFAAEKQNALMLSEPVGKIKWLNFLSICFLVRIL